MKINKLTITGADNSNNYNQLFELQQKYPFVEWGILYSKAKEGENRYPLLSHITSQFANSSSVLNLSAHFCGWYSKEVIENCNYELIDSLPSQFQRVQLNFNFRNSNKFKLEELVEYAKTSKRNIIFQYNRDNKTTLDNLMSTNIPQNIHFLYDSSGGRGTEIQSIESDFKNYTGYSGGINDENISYICELITNTSGGTVWVDMESGVRTDNRLDLKKVEKVLEITDSYIKNTALKHHHFFNERLPLQVDYLHLIN